MKEVQSLLKIVSDGLKTLAQGVEAIAEKLDDVREALRRGDIKTASKLAKVYHLIPISK